MKDSSVAVGKHTFQNWPPSSLAQMAKLRERERAAVVRLTRERFKRERYKQDQISGSEELNVIFWLFQGCQNPQNTPPDFAQVCPVRLLSLCVCSSAPPAVKQSQTCSCLCIRDREQAKRDNSFPGSLCCYTVPEMDHMPLLARGFTLGPCVGGFYFILLPLNFWPLPPAPACCVVHFRPSPGCVCPLRPTPANILNIHSHTIVPLILWLLLKTQCLILMKGIHTCR